jgi:hypothetical protein
MLQFFEALAEFLAVIHLSAFSDHPAVWAGIKDRLTSILRESKLSIRHATFGVWTRICEYLSSELRRLRHNEEEACFEVYSVLPARLPESFRLIG